MVDINPVVDILGLKLVKKIRYLKIFVQYLFKIDSKVQNIILKNFHTYFKKLSCWYKITFNAAIQRLY